MNDRQKELLKKLLINQEETTQIQNLAEHLTCSEKTVRNDLERIVDFLTAYPDIMIHRTPGIGISIQVTDEERADLLRTLQSTEPKVAEDRLLEIAYQLLISNQAITLQHFADQYYMPKVAIKKDLAIIQRWLQQYDLEIESKPRLGNIIRGFELQKRNALAHLSDLLPTVMNERNFILDLFQSYEIDVVRRALEDMQNHFPISLAEGESDSLLVHALIMVKRIRQKSPVSITAAEKKQATNLKEYAMTAWFFGRLASAFRLAVPESERVYFTWHLASTKRSDEESARVIVEDEEAVEIVQAVIGKMRQLTLFPFETDPTLMEGLTLHLRSVINRIRYGFPITNPLLSDIKKMYPYMFDMVILAFEEIKQNYQLDISEDEAAYLVLHFQASIERRDNRKESKSRVLIVCHMGIGLSQLLEAKIEQHYREIEIIGCVGKEEVAHYTRHHPVDFIISTIPLEQAPAEFIVISPLFGQEDKKKLSRFIEMQNQARGDLLEPDAFAHFLPENLLFFNVGEEHRYEVVEKLATELCRQGFVKREFIHNAVSRERKSATAIGGGIAIPHGNPALIHKTAIAAAVLDRPIEWGGEQVSLVFMLAVGNDQQGKMRGLIGRIAALSETPLIGLQLTETDNYVDFMRIVKGNVKKT